MDRPNPTARISPVSGAERIRAIATLSDAERIKARIRETYGFEVTDAYARDFADFVVDTMLAPAGRRP